VRNPSIGIQPALIPGLTAGAGCERWNTVVPTFSPAREGGGKLTDGLRNVEDSLRLAQSK
ncbi:MAG TPA: hypothetical protein VH639_15800, partial [Bryobacteraceae bacterium]